MPTSSSSNSVTASGQRNQIGSNSAAILFEIPGQACRAEIDHGRRADHADGKGKHQQHIEHEPETPQPHPVLRRDRKQWRSTVRRRLHRQKRLHEKCAGKPPRQSTASPEKSRAETKKRVSTLPESPGRARPSHYSARRDRNWSRGSASAAGTPPAAEAEGTTRASAAPRPESFELQKCRRQQCENDAPRPPD